MQRVPCARKFGIFLTKKFSPPTGGFFLAPAEGKGHSGPEVILADGRMDGRTDNGLKGVRFVKCVLFPQPASSVGGPRLA